MRLGRRLSAGIAEDPPAPRTPEAPPVEAASVDAPVEVVSAEHREPAAQLADR